MFQNDTDHFDQHFLINNDIISTFIKESHLSKKDVVVEIGPGKGQITTLIAPKVKHLTCIELDTKLKPYLEELKKKNKNIDIIYGSALDIFIPDCNKIITSLPYSIIEPFINKLIRCKFDEIIMITGKKYADGVINKDMNKLSLITNCYFKSEYIMDITPDSFMPAPRVMSSMIRLIPKSIEEIEDFNTLMFRFMFYFNDKKVKNALIESLIRVGERKGYTITQRISKQIINSINIDNELSSKVFSTCSNKELLEINNIINEIEILKDKELEANA